MGDDARAFVSQQKKLYEVLQDPLKIRQGFQTSYEIDKSIFYSRAVFYKILQDCFVKSFLLGVQRTRPCWYPKALTHIYKIWYS